MHQTISLKCIDKNCNLSTCNVLSQRLHLLKTIFQHSLLTLLSSVWTMKSKLYCRIFQSLLFLSDFPFNQFVLVQELFFVCFMFFYYLSVWYSYFFVFIFESEVKFHQFTAFYLKKWYLYFSSNIFLATFF